VSSLYRLADLLIPICSGTNTAVVPQLKELLLFEHTKLGEQPILPRLIAVTITNKHC
jgi:hypothetical protein